MPRTLVVFISLVAFALQGFVTQTHLHFAHAADIAALAQAIDGIGSAKVDKTKLPSDNDSKHCPICEEMGLAGVYVTPTAVFLVLPQATVSIVAIVVRASVHVEAVSHDWRGRAPPHH